MRKKDVILIAIVLAVAAGLYGVTLLTRGGQTISGDVAIYVGGALHSRVPLDVDREVCVEQENGHVNVVRIEDGGVCMAFSSCRNQLCVQQGTVTPDNWATRAMGRSIICLPNQVVVELALADAHPSMEDYDAPDI